jgi:putative ATPase
VNHQAIRQADQGRVVAVAEEHRVRPSPQAVGRPALLGRHEARPRGGAHFPRTGQSVQDGLPPAGSQRSKGSPRRGTSNDAPQGAVTERTVGLIAVRQAGGEPSERAFVFPGHVCNEFISEELARKEVMIPRNERQRDSPSAKPPQCVAHRRDERRNVTRPTPPGVKEVTKDDQTVDVQPVDPFDQRPLTQIGSGDVSIRYDGCAHRRDHSPLSLTRSPTVATAPLPARMRPRTLDEVLGQDQVVAPDAPFRQAVEGGHLPSVLLWGPPGTGKTTIARLLAEAGGLRFRQLSAVASGMKDLRHIVEEVNGKGGGGGLFDRGSSAGVLLFVDEIHRWNKAQQDALLPHVEEGTVVLVGATTENPAFEVIPALRSRCWLLRLTPLSDDAITQLLRRALTDPDRGLGELQVVATDEAIDAIASYCAGDARRALGLLERAAHAVAQKGTLDLPAVGRLLGERDLGHDAGGDAHFDVVSAFIKSMRGSDPDAALYWMARMLEGGEDPMFIARRIVIQAAEDVGNADPRALTVAVSAMQAVHLIGLPEARIPLAQACIYVSTAPKSNAAYKGIDAAVDAVRRTGGLPVPLHLRNAPTQLAKTLGHGEGYQNPHGQPLGIVAQEHLPPELVGSRFYKPVDHGAEKGIQDRMKWWAARLDEREGH